MDLKLIPVVILGSSLVVQSSSSMAGRTYAVRSVEELKLMTEPELAGESRLVCREIGLNNSTMRYYRENQKGTPADALRELKEAESGQRYLERIGFVARDQHHGQMPEWFTQMVQAAKSDDGPTADETCAAAATLGGWHK